MKALKIQGGKELKGTIRISGAKNSSVALIPAAILADDVVTICNVPEITDIDALSDLLEYLTADVKRASESIVIDPKTSSQKVIRSKTQKNHTLEGFDLGGLQDGATIPEGTDLDTLLEMISKKVISPEYEAPQILIEDSSAKKEFEVGEQVPVSINSRFIK